MTPVYTGSSCFDINGTTLTNPAGEFSGSAGEFSGNLVVKTRLSRAKKTRFRDLPFDLVSV
jgi:hypothetical protein